MTLTTIEKAAKLMGYDLSEWHPPFMKHLGATITSSNDKEKMFFNPYTNKADLVDVECALEIDVEWQHTDGYLSAQWWDFKDVLASGRVYLNDHPNKFTARAHAVMAVVEQIYDRREG